MQIKRTGEKDMDDIRVLMEEVDLRIADTRKVHGGCHEHEHDDMVVKRISKRSRTPPRADICVLR